MPAVPHRQGRRFKIDRLGFYTAGTFPGTFPDALFPIARPDRPLPQPMSWGSISQGMLRSTKRMPVKAARSDTRGRPPFGFGFSGGNSATNTYDLSSRSARILRPQDITDAVRRSKGGAGTFSPQQVTTMANESILHSGQDPEPRGFKWIGKQPMPPRER